jgi:hypothetical protein
MHGENFTEFTPEVELGSGLLVAPMGVCECVLPERCRWNWKISKGYLYVWVLYWTITTMTTIGYGDLTPQTGFEAIMTIGVQLVGASVFGEHVYVGSMLVPAHRALFRSHLRPAPNPP